MCSLTVSIYKIYPTTCHLSLKDLSFQLEDPNFRFRNNSPNIQATVPLSSLPTLYHDNLSASISNQFYNVPTIYSPAEDRFGEQAALG